jgi:hypothetical protein
MSGIDWSPVTTAIIALIATMITTFIPMAIKLFFEAQEARMVNLKRVVQSNQKIVDDIVMVIQQTANTLSNSDKYNLALGKASEALHLPANTLHDMIELAVANAKMEWGKDWDAIGGDTIPPAAP